MKALNETVVLLHGMGRSRASMWPLARRLRLAGYSVLNFPYVPWRHPVGALSDQLHAFVEARVTTDTYHFIGHSLGNIIVRAGCDRPWRAGLGRIVMLAPPNHLPEKAVRLKDNPIYRLVFGKSGQDITAQSFYDGLPRPSAPVGILAGDRGLWFSFDVPSDGVVTVESTKLDGMADFRVVRRSHTFIMNGPVTAALCVDFLRHGEFRGNS